MTTILNTISLDPILRAQKQFEAFRINMLDDRDKAGAIQAFEFCFELAWKTTKRILEAKGLQANSPREVFRLAARDGIISDPTIWFVFLEKRNLTAHTYNEDIVDEIIAIFDQFSLELKNLINALQATK